MNRHLLMMLAGGFPQQVEGPGGSTAGEAVPTETVQASPTGEASDGTDAEATTETVVENDKAVAAEEPAETAPAAASKEPTLTEVLEKMEALEKRITGFVLGQKAVIRQEAKADAAAVTEAGVRELNENVVQAKLSLPDFRAKVEAMEQRFGIIEGRQELLDGIFEVFLHSGLLEALAKLGPEHFEFLGLLYQPPAGPPSLTGNTAGESQSS